MHALENSGDRRAALVNRLLGIRERLIGAMLIGNNIVNIGASAFTTSVLVQFFGDGRRDLRHRRHVAPGDRVRRGAAQDRRDQHARPGLADPRPPGVLGGGAVRAADHGDRARSCALCCASSGSTIGENQPILSATEEIRGTVDLLHREGGVARPSATCSAACSISRSSTVSDVMVHRTKMRTINADLTSEEIVREVLASPYTRLPLWRGSRRTSSACCMPRICCARSTRSAATPELNVEAIALEPGSCPTRPRFATSSRRSSPRRPTSPSWSTSMAR